MSKENNSLAFGCVGILLGAFLTWGILDPSADDDLDGLAGETAELSDVVSQLGQRIEEFGNQIADLDGPSQASPIPMLRTPLESESSAELLARLERLETTLAELAEALKNMPTQESYATHPPPLLVQPERPMNHAALQSLIDVDEIDLDLNHLGWSYQQVLEAYGKPTRNGPSPGGGGQKWYYQLPGDELMIFWFLNNRVSRVFY